MKYIILPAKWTPKLFWNNVSIGKSEECWNWMRCISGRGYGMLNIQGSGTVLAHRVAYFLGNGQDPFPMLVCHKCDNRSCCNPDHLFLGTSADNMLDCKRKNRTVRGERHNRATLSDETVSAIRGFASGGDAATKIAKAMGIPYRVVWRIVTNRTRALQPQQGVSR